MPTYLVSGAVAASTFVGKYEASCHEEAIELARKDAGISLCHECSRQVSDPEVEWLSAEDDDTGECVSEKSSHDEIVEQAEIIKQLRRALQHIANTCIQDPDTAQFAARVLDGSAKAPAGNL